MKITCLLSGLCLLLALSAYTQAPELSEKYQLRIRKSAEPMRLDGTMDEPAWQNAQVAKDFFQNFPFDTAFSVLKSEVRITFDQNFLYIGAVLYQNQADYITTSLKRDFVSGVSDVFSINIDPFNDKLNGFHFAVTPFNVQREGMIDNGTNMSPDWDNKWYSEISNHTDHWVVEMAIPFKTLRYQLVAGQNVWRMNFIRFGLKQNEASTWVPVPRAFRPLHMAYTGFMVWEDAPPQPGANVSIIPYAIARTEKDFEFKLPTETKANIGGDAKIAITPSLNLDLTLNPDFSQVDVDRQITNLSRFELFFPERRQFFLENADLFGSFGSQNLRPFFSRRIGIAKDTTTDLNVQNPIYFGARLSGKLDKNWRMGFLSMQTARDYDISQPSTNYTVGVLQRKVFSRSNIGIIAINKQPFRDKLLETASYDFNRVVGIDYNLASNDNKWTGKFFHHRTFDPALTGGNNGASSATINYNALNWDVFFTLQDVGANFNPEVGFARRTDYRRAAGTINWKFYPKKGTLQSHGPGLDFDVLGNDTYGTTDWDLNILYRLRFRNSAIVDFRMRRE